MPVERLCVRPGCPSVAEYRGRCRAHAAPLNRDRSPRLRGYGSKWDRIARAVLREEPLCRLCRAEDRVTPAELVDHKTPKRSGGTDERSNLQPLCRVCHARKTREDAKC